MKRLATVALFLALAACSGTASPPSSADSAGIVPPLNALATVRPGAPLLVQTETTGARREVRYNGLAGRTLSVGYRDSGGATQDYRFDLGQGYVLRLGAARVAVVDVSETEIHYRVLSGF